MRKAKTKKMILLELLGLERLFEILVACRFTYKISHQGPLAKQHLRAGTVCTASSLKRSENKAAYEVTTRVDQGIVRKVPVNFVDKNSPKNRTVLKGSSWPRATPPAV